MRSCSFIASKSFLYYSFISFSLSSSVRSGYIAILPHIEALKSGFSSSFFSSSPCSSSNPDSWKSNASAKFSSYSSSSVSEELESLKSSQRVSKLSSGSGYFSGISFGSSGWDCVAIFSLCLSLVWRINSIALSCFGGSTLPCAFQFTSSGRLSTIFCVSPALSSIIGLGGITF